MSKMVIRKRLILEFLGEDYKDAYLVFHTLPVSEYEKMVQNEKEAGDDRIKSTMQMFELVKSKFVEGKFPNEKGELVEITQQDFEVDEGLLVKCFQFITGQEPDPKS